MNIYKFSALLLFTAVIAGPGMAALQWHRVQSLQQGDSINQVATTLKSRPAFEAQTTYKHMPYLAQYMKVNSGQYYVLLYNHDVSFRLFAWGPENKLKSSSNPTVRAVMHELDKKKVKLKR